MRTNETARTGLEELPVLDHLGQIAEFVQAFDAVYIRYSHGPDADAGIVSTDKESGCRLPGLSSNPITPEPWWDRHVEDWIARQLCQYGHLGQREGVAPWLLTGAVVGRGPDCEPLLTESTPLAVIGELCLEQAVRRYRTAFAVGRV